MDETQAQSGVNGGAYDLGTADHIVPVFRCRADAFPAQPDIRVTALGADRRSLGNNWVVNRDHPLGPGGDLEFITSARGEGVHFFLRVTPGDLPEAVESFILTVSLPDEAARQSFMAARVYLVVLNNDTPIVRLNLFSPDLPDPDGPTLICGEIRRDQQGGWRFFTPAAVEQPLEL